MSKPHQCSVCGKVGQWGTSWEWYGSVLLEDWEPAAIVITCGPVCRESPAVKPLQKAADKINAIALAAAKRIDKLTEQDPTRGYY